MKRYMRTRNAVFNVGYHITFSPKYRKPFLWKVNVSYLQRLFEVAAITVRGKVSNVEIMPDHVHIFIKMRQNHVAVSRIVQALKGYTSFMMRKKHPWMKQFKSLWSSGYFVESVGNMSEHVIQKYINNQRTSVKPTYKYKHLVIDSTKTMKTPSEQRVKDMVYSSFYDRDPTNLYDSDSNQERRVICQGCNSHRNDGKK